MTKIQIFETVCLSSLDISSYKSVSWFESFEHLNLDFVSYFEIRVSDFSTPLLIEKG